MADETEGKGARQESDVKQSFAWGRRFVGSVVAGFAVWRLGHKLTSTEPSAWFAGLSAAYEQVLDFVLIPFDWIDLDLTASEKNVLTICIVLISSVAKALLNFRSLAFAFARGFFAFVCGYWAIGGQGARRWNFQ